MLRVSWYLLNSTKEIHILILEPVFLLVFLVCDLLVLIFTKFDDIVKILEGIVHPLDKQVGMLHYIYIGINHYFPDSVLMFLLSWYCRHSTVDDEDVFVIIFPSQQAGPLRLLNEGGREEKPLLFCRDTACNDGFGLADAGHPSDADQTVALFLENFSEEINQYTDLLTG